MSAEDTRVAWRQAFRPLQELLPAHGAEQFTRHLLSPSAPPTPCVNQTLRPDAVSSARKRPGVTARLVMLSAMISYSESQLCASATARVSPAGLPEGGLSARKALPLARLLYAHDMRSDRKQQTRTPIDHHDRAVP